MNIVLRDHDLHFQGQTFSCYAFSKAKNAQVAIVPADMPRLERLAPWAALVANGYPPRICV